MDVYCKVCGEPWDLYSVKEDMSEEERKQFLAGKGCPCCKGLPTYYCEKCDKFYKGWMRSDMMDEEIELVWKLHKCPECLSPLKLVRFDNEWEFSIIDADGALEDLTGVSAIDLL